MLKKHSPGKKGSGFPFYQPTVILDPLNNFMAHYEPLMDVDGFYFMLSTLKHMKSE